MLAINPEFVDDGAMTDARLVWTSFRATFRLEIAEALRSRWWAAYATVFFALTGLLLTFGLTESRVLGFTGLSRTLVTYTQLAMAIAPVFVLISTVRSLAGDREAGVFEYVLALPLSLGGWYAGRVLGRFALAVAPVAGALAAALVYGAARGVAIPWREFVFDMGLLASLVFAFIGLGFLVSTVTRKVDTAQTLAFVIWLGLLLALDLILLGVLIRNQAMPAQLSLRIGRLLERGGILLEERVVGAPLALNERVADEHLAGQFPGGVGADGVEEDLAVGHQRHAVERHLLLAHGGAIA